MEVGIEEVYDRQRGADAIPSLQGNVTGIRTRYERVTIASVMLETQYPTFGTYVEIHRLFCSEGPIRRVGLDKKWVNEELEVGYTTSSPSQSLRSPTFILLRVILS
jgi:hypothetical protein